MLFCPILSPLEKIFFIIIIVIIIAVVIIIIFFYNISYSYNFKTIHKQMLIYRPVKEV